LRSVDDGTVLGNITHDGAISAAAFDAEGMRLATAGGMLDPCAKVWSLDPPTDPPAQTAEVTHGQVTQIASVAFSPDGRCLATAGRGGAIRIWSLPAGVLLWSPQSVYDAAAINVAYDASGVRVACARADGVVTVYSTEALSGLDDDNFAGVERMAGWDSVTKNYFKNCVWLNMAPVSSRPP
jgi:WD40 repeat protein